MRGFLAVIAASLAIVLAALSGPAPARLRVAQAAACPSGATLGLTVNSMTSGGVQRSYRLYVPSSYDASAPLPLVLNFHGYGSNAQEQEDYTGLAALAESHGFVLVTPDGTGTPRHWYIFGNSEPGYVDDIAFVEDLIDEVSSSVCIDQSHIYATGISDGAVLSSQLGCKSNRIAAIAPVAGSPYSDPLCHSAGPVPIIAFHGTDDAYVPFDIVGSIGQTPNTAFIEGLFEGLMSLNLGAFVSSHSSTMTLTPGIFAASDVHNAASYNLSLTPRTATPSLSVRGNMHDWAVHNGCDLTLHSQRIAEDVVLESYTNCDDNADVFLYVIEGGGHTWPGAVNVPRLGPTTHSIDASELIWAFFASH